MSYENYGDVALDLPADWSRAKHEGKTSAFIGMTVGHTDGVADAYLTERPTERHQFQWINIKDEVDLNHKLTQGFQLVNKDEWTKNPHLWRWTPEGHVSFMGQELYARAEALYFADKAEREGTANARDIDKETAELIAEAAEKSRDVAAFDASGAPLKRTARR